MEFIQSFIPDFKIRVYPYLNPFFHFFKLIIKQSTKYTKDKRFSYKK